MERFGFSLEKGWDYENGFYLTSNITRIAKILAHYELYKRIVNLPGHIVEFGVFKGASLIQWLTFRELLESPFSRKIIGFDMFGKFPRNLTLSEDVEFVSNWEGVSGTGIPIEDLEFFLNGKKFQNFELVPGDITVTLKDFLDMNPQYRFSMAHIDVDVYDPSKAVLDLIIPRMVRGGLLVFDDYNADSKVVGETIALEENEFLKGYRIEKLPISQIPAFVVL